MKNNIRTLGELQKHIQGLIKKYGSDSSCVAWLITNDELSTIDNKTGGIVPVGKSDVKSICLDVEKGEYQFVNREVQRVIRNGKVARGL